MKVAVLAMIATMGGAFVTPGPRATATYSGPDRSSATAAAQSPTSRAETSAVSPLNIAGLDLSSITDIFSRKRCLRLPSFIAWHYSVGWITLATLFGCCTAVLRGNCCKRVFQNVCSRGAPCLNIVAVSTFL